MAINLLRLARFVDGERPSAEKFNKLFSYIENKLSGFDSSIGSSINNGLTSIVDGNNQTFDIKINNIWGISKFLAEDVINGKARHSDIISLVKSIGSMSNLNPLTLGGESIIKETIPAGVNEYVFKYPVLIQNPKKDSLTFSPNPIWLNQETGLIEEDGHLLEFGQWKLWKSFEIDGETNTTISYAKSMVWYTPSITPVEITYKTNSENWGGGANYQGSSFNVIPDFNTPKTALNSEDEDGFFYNLKFTNNNTTYTTVELPYALYQQTALSRNELDTALLSEADINHKKRLTLPKYLKDYQLTLQPPTEFPLPKGFLTLVDFSEDTFTILDDLNYIYVDEYTFKVNISSSILNCVTANPNSPTYKQLFLLVNGTDITRSINDLQIKQNKHSHDGSFGESLIHIKDIAGIFERADRNVYFPSTRGGHIATQYLHRDGYRYNNDTQNYDNAIMGDLLISGNKENNNKRSYKIYFKDYNSSVLGLNSSPGYFSTPGLSSNSWCWIGLSSIPTLTSSWNTLNIQGAEDGNVSILSNNNLVVASKDRIVSIIKEINNEDLSVDIIKNSFEWNDIQDEQSVQIQTEDLNANINQTQISLYNNNNSLNLFNWNNSSPTISLISKNKNKPYSGLPDQTGTEVGLNSIHLISESNNSSKNEIKFFTQGTQTSLFQIKEEYLSDKRSSADKDYFKKEIPSYKKQYTKTPVSLFEEQVGSLENTNVIEVNNSTQKKEGCFVYVIQHLVDDRNNPNFKYFYLGPNNTDTTTSSQLRNMIHKKHIFNKTYDLARQEKILNKQSIYNTFTNMNPINSYWSDENVYKRLSGDPLFVDPVNGKLRFYLKNEETQQEHDDWLELVATNNLGDGNHYNSTKEKYPSPEGINRDNYVLERWYKHNPFPCSKEYVDQHFYIYAFREYDTDRKIYRITEEFGDLLFPPTIESNFNYFQNFLKTRTLTKIVWKKYWLKENINSSSFDFDELLLNGEESYNNNKYVLVNQGYLIDCAIPPSNEHSVEVYNWVFSVEEETKARNNNLKRVCQFYEVDKDSDFYSIYPNWIAGKSFNPTVTVVDGVGHNNQANDATIEGGLPFTRHGNLQTLSDYESFFSYFKKHEFEDDNVIMYFGKGFVNFNKLVSQSEYPNSVEYDIVRDNYWTSDSELERTLNIKLKDKEETDRNYKSKQNMKIIFSDFNGENLNLLNEILLDRGETALPDCFIFEEEKGPASSVTQYLWKTWRERKEWNNYENYRNEIFKYSLDSKLYNSINWIFGVILCSIDDFSYQVNLFNEFPNKSINLGSINNSLFWTKHLNFTSAYPYQNQLNIFGEQTFNNHEHFFSKVKPRTFFTYFNIVFDKENFDSSFERKINNQINLKTNGANDNFINSNNLIISLKNRSTGYVDPNVNDYSIVKSFNIGPIQGFYNIEIDRFTNNERSYWSIADKILLNEKFGCSLFDIKVNTDMNFCFIC